METDGEQGTDAAPIKPVSSLRAKFEGLQIQNANKLDGTFATESPTTPKPGDPYRSSPFVRGSLDLPRPQSPWNAGSEPSQLLPPTPGSRARGSKSESPNRSGPRRPMSMLADSSPQFTPAVHVESPRSPPRTSFSRSPSKSPERVQIPPLRKVKDLVSQHSSRESTRASTPASEHAEGSTAALKDISGEKNWNGAPRPKSPIPPPINRAEKPKIPAKPQTIALPARDQGLATQTAPDPADSAASPFNTPPSSDDDLPSLELPKHSSQDTIPNSFLDRGTVAHQEAAVAVNTKPRDARLMGFSSASSTATGRKDTRLLGFSPAEPPRPPSRDTKPSASPTRAATVSERTRKDAREFGFGPGRSNVRHVSESVRAPLQSTIKPEVRPIESSGRDPRQYGFSRSNTLPSQDEEDDDEEIEQRPDLPNRPTTRVPPPRPSEESKRPVYHPSITRTVPSRPQIHSASENRPKISSDIPRQLVPAPSDMRFPPPPKRSTFGDSDEMETQNAPLSRQQQGTARSTPAVPSPSRRRSDSDEAEGSLQESPFVKHEYPDATQTNRRPPFYTSGLREINGRNDGKVFDICGQYLCTTGYITRVFDMSTGQAILAVNHGETVKMTAAKFKPGSSAETEGLKLWLGSNIGDIHEVDLEIHAIVATSSAHNRREIFGIFRHRKNLWTLDDDGKLLVWLADESGTPNFKYSRTSFKTARGPTFALVAHDNIWVASGKEIRVYCPENDAAFNVLKQPLSQSGNGDVTSGAFSPQGSGKVYFGHADGKVSIYSTRDYSCLENIKVSDYKINGLAFAGDKLWAAYKTGKIYVYDTSSTPWKVNKDWKAHDGPATGILLDPSSVWTLQRMQVATIGHDNHIRLWDGMLEEDWMENEMHRRNAEYCSFREVRAAVVTWNCGATVPALLRNDHFIADAILAHEADPPEILVFGFQEVVDLEDRTVTAKSLLGLGKKKDTTKTEQQHQSRVYREWRDYLRRAIEQFCPHQFYEELHTSSLIGLFQCVFIRQSERKHVSNRAPASVKCGMGGHYGNKGALIARFVLDDSSLCFINCHLAAGQTQTSHRNNDVATILESDALPAEHNLDTRMSLYVGGGDGAQILDHEICILNGDLNYRIDAIPRNTVIDMIKRNELSKLLERDQINVSRRRVSGFRLASFTELPITFPPTYKYDVGKDTYDSSDKKRSPAWCDRLLYRGPGRVKQLEYRRHEGVRHSDHRPVSGIFKLKIKSVDVQRRDRVKEDCYQRFAEVKRKSAEAASIGYLVDSLGVDSNEAKRLITIG